MHTYGNPHASHLYEMEVRRQVDGRWETIRVHAESRLGAARVANENGYVAGGGDCDQIR